MKKIAILGGTFDPVHNAHVELARRALEQYKLDKTLFMPTGRPVRKLGKTYASALDRLNMLKIACADIPEFEVSALEIQRPRVTYTIDTLRELRKTFGDTSQLYLIMGEDSATDVGTWRDAAEIARLAIILYARRPGLTQLNNLPEGFTFHEIEMPPQDLSSSFVRHLLIRGEDASAYVPAEVLAYIEKHDVYGKFR